MKTSKSRQRRASRSLAQKDLWLISFSDLATLLMALFVMLFSMTSIDSGLIERISSNMRGSSHTPLAMGGMNDSRYELALELLGDSQKLSQNQDTIKNLLFNDVLPPELVAGMIKDNVVILSREGGVAIVFAEDIIFEPGSAVIPKRGRSILEALTPLLKTASYDILITGHSDDNVYAAGGKTAQKLAQYQLSGARALSALKLYLDANIDKKRFAIAGYGPDHPLAASQSYTVGNRRIEIVLKNAKNMYP
jgi:chemotaxis protein MotB